MQGKFALFTDLWDGICQLKGELSSCLEAFVNDDFSRLGLASPSPTEKEMFIAAIRATMKNMTVRFACPSSSLNKRHLQNRDASRDGSVDMHAVARAYSSCPLRELFDVYSFPDEFLRHSTIKEHLLLELNGEVRRLCIKLSGLREEILSNFSAPSTNAVSSSDNHTQRISLDELFQHVSRSDFPLLWKCVLEVQVVNPTTVSCERCFSCLQSFS